MNPRQYANTVASVVSRWTALALVGLAFASGCTPSSRRTPDDTVVVVVETAMMTADPRAVLSSLDGKLARLIAAGLTAVDTETMEPRLDLASRIDRVDRLTMDVTVRDDARFSDGSPVTAADVAGTYMNVLSPDSTSASHKMLSDRFTRVEVVAPQVVRFHLKAPLATFASDLDYGIISFHRGTPPVGQALGAGPYQLRELTSTEARLEPNPFYFGDPPKLANVEIKFVRDAAARLLMLVGGSADLLQNAVRLDLVSVVRDRPRVHFASRDGSILTYLMMNNEDPVLSRREVRQAIAHAIDRRAIIAAKLPDLAIPATGLLAPKHWAYNGNVTRYDHDPERARQLLDQAGLRDPDGDGPAPRLRLVYKTSADAFRVALARVIAAQLGEVGIAVELRSFEFATFYADVKKGAYQLASMQTAEITEPDFYFMYFHSSWIPTPANPDGFNRWRYRNDKLDDLTRRGREELDRNERIKLYAEVQQIVAADVPIVPLWHEKNVVLTNVDVEGYQVTPNARLGGLRHVTKRR
jgi:peptide/nickel transport system substrate-binding protein